MIKKLSQRLLQYLLDSGVIEDTNDEKEYYQYGIEITISSVLNIILILGIGLLTWNILESVIFLLLFIPIRQFTGDFHASTYFKCNLSFCIVFSLILVLYHFAGVINTYLSILITFICVLLIIAKCPIENKNKPIPEERKKVHKIMAALLGTIYGITGIVFTAISNKYGALILYTLAAVAVLIIAAMLQDRRCKYAERKEKC
jgi:accessory gene regulator B